MAYRIKYIHLDGRPGGRGPNDLMNKKISHLPGVIGAVQAEGWKIHAKAEAKLSMHRDTGTAFIDIEFHDTDTHVYLVDEAAMSIEFGHNVEGKYAYNKDGKVVPVEGLSIITDAAYAG